MPLTRTQLIDIAIQLQVAPNFREAWLALPFSTRIQLNAVLKEMKTP